MAGIGFVPLFGGPGYEHSFASGLILPSAAAIATALEVARGRTASPLASVGRGVVTGLVLAAVSLATAVLHVLRVGLCEWWGTLGYYALTAGAGAVMGGAWGACVGEGILGRVQRVRTWSVLLALLGPIAMIAVSVERFVTSPMVFAFDPFVGYFSGTLYDTVIDAGTSLLTYRFGSLMTLAALALGASVLERSPLTLDLRSAGTRARAALAVVALVSSVTMFLLGPRLGHWSTPESIAKELGAERHGARCDVVHPSTIRDDEARLLVKDCDEQLAAVEKRLGARGPERVRAYFFRDANEKKRLMGAANVYIAKPWRHEVYLQLGGFPHPVLGHELAHVVAGSFGRGPFRVAGDVGGLLPNPGLIEGVAVHAAPEDDDLSGTEWARAMKDLGILPPLRTVFSLGFLGGASSKSYTVAGSFIDFVAEHYGEETVRRWYGGERLDDLVKKPFAAVEASWLAELDSLVLPAEAAAFAKARFARPGVFGRRCPHVVDGLRKEADTCRDTQRWEEAIETYRKALALDAQDHASRQALAQVQRRHGDAEEGRKSLEAIASNDATPRTWKDRATEALADADLLDGRNEAAAASYEKLAAATLDEDAARTLEVKAIAARDPRAREPIVALLLGDGTRGPDPFASGLALGRFAEHGAAEDASSAALAGYLIGRNLLQRGFHAEAAKALDVVTANLERLPTARLQREAVRQRVVAACAAGDRTSLTRMRLHVERPNGPFATVTGRRQAIARLIDRCSDDSHRFTSVP